MLATESRNEEQWNEKLFVKRKREEPEQVVKAVEGELKSRSSRREGWYDKNRSK